MNKKQRVSATQEDYLEAILHLIREKGDARVGDIAQELSVHKSTVTAALKALNEKGLIHYAPYELATLTDKGRQIAQRVTRGHAVIRSFLREVLLTDEETAERNACRMEHAMDKDVLDRLALFARALKECPESAANCLRRYAAAKKKGLGAQQTKGGSSDSDD